MSNWSTWLNLAAYVVAGAAVLARGIAGRTVTKKDDEVASWLEWLHDMLAKFGFQGASLQDKRTTYQVKEANRAAAALNSDAQ